MTFISWSLEFIAGLFCWIHWISKNEVIVRWFVLSDIVLNFILLPMSYVLNNDVNKAIIVADGWVQGIRRLINRKSIVVPEQNNEVENPGNPNPIPFPIPTISRNIDALENQGHRHGNNFSQPTSVGFTTQQLPTVADQIENVQSSSHICHSESNQNLPEDPVDFSRRNRVDLCEGEDEIETIPLDDITKSSGRACLIDSSRVPAENAWI